MLENLISNCWDIFKDNCRQEIDLRLKEGEYDDDFTFFSQLFY